MKPQERYAALPKPEKKRLRVAFDCDETLWNNGTQKPIMEVVLLYRALKNLGCYMIVWSAGGQLWAEEVSRLCGLRPDEIREKPPIGSKEVDLAIDDAEDLGTITLFV